MPHHPSAAALPASLTRRSLLARALAAPLAIAIATRNGAAAASAPTTNAISLAQWSLHRALFDGGLDPLDFPKRARELGIRRVEYVNQFYRSRGAGSGSGSDAPWLGELAKRCAGEGVTSQLIMVDGEGDLGDPDATRRGASVERHRRWLDAAKALGCFAIRVNARSTGSPAEQTSLLIDGLGRLCDLAQPLGLAVLIENHGGQSSDGVWLAATVRAVGKGNCGTLPDFGNFRITASEWADRYAGIAALVPLAKALSAKSYDFGPDGEETTIDFARMLSIARAAGYGGAIGIEYEGRRLAEPEGILATKRLLERLGCSADS